MSPLALKLHVFSPIQPPRALEQLQFLFSDAFMTLWSPYHWEEPERERPVAWFPIFFKSVREGDAVVCEQRRS
jgi:hypothetical protein